LDASSYALLEVTNDAGLEVNEDATELSQTAKAALQGGKVSTPQSFFDPVRDES
jgi:hypothetical protein